MADRLKPFFTYFGGKYRIAPRYPSPEYGTIVEPFAGAAGYSLRYPDRGIVLVDLNETVVGTWNYLIHVSPEEVRRLPLYDGSWETTRDLTYLPQEARWLIGWWLNKGTTGPSYRPSKWVRETPPDRIGENYWGPGIRERIANQVDRIRHWKVAQASYEHIPDFPATWYVDPPYQVAGSSYKHSTVDYTHLGEWCRNRTGQTIVCENSGADWLPFEDFLPAKATAGRYRSGVSREVIWVGHRGAQGVDKVAIEKAANKAANNNMAEVEKRLAKKPLKRRKR